MNLGAFSASALSPSAGGGPDRAPPQGWVRGLAGTHVPLQAPLVGGYPPRDLDESLPLGWRGGGLGARAPRLCKEKNGICRPA